MFGRTNACHVSGQIFSNVDVSPKKGILVAVGVGWPGYLLYIVKFSWKSMSKFIKCKCI